jgi:hypothetical protein
MMLKIEICMFVKTTNFSLWYVVSNVHKNVKKILRKMLYHGLGYNERYWSSFVDKPIIYDLIP